jgi:two-component system response regulator PilR (NtrC family)
VVAYPLARMTTVIPAAARVLVVDDEQSLRRMMEVMLQRAGHEVTLATGVATAREIIDGAAAPFDVVITDLVMPDGSGLDVLDHARARSSETQVIVVTAHASVETAVDAMQRGAYGYLEKPIGVATARAMIDKALEKRLLLRDNAALRALARAAQPSGAPLVGRSAAIQAALDLVRRAAPSRASVLITGESGTGKEVFARILHAESDRREGPFVVVNCGAIPETLLESELFGHEKGAFTGAVARRDGLFRHADGGTLFLDEVGELPLALQPKLLRALQERKVRAVGGNSEIAVDVRIVAATNRDLEADVRAGRFRQDVYYRLNVLRIRLPPLRERREDLPLLVEHFRARFAAEQGRPLAAFTPDAMRALVAYDYPGNVREVENAVERAVTLARGSTIELVDLPPEISGGPVVPSSEPVLPSDGIDLERYLATVERALLRQALDRAEGVRTRAAQLVGLSFRSFRYRLAKLGLAAPNESEVEPDPGEVRNDRTFKRD